MSKYIFTILMGICSVALQAQNFAIRGRLIDESGSGLPSATILLLNAKDSVMVNYGISNNDGQFEVRNIRRGEYLLRLSYIGFATVTFPVFPPEGNLLELGDLKLPEETKLLGEVTVEQERIPMRIKSDTIEYDALAFRPLPNEMVEDLLKRMPGMVVASDGTVEAQGEQVRRVLVDGKEFFGRDPKMATQNIPADAVDKVQVFDQRSEQALFTGIDDGERERTLNLELKEDRKEASFGNTSLGYGPDNRFHGRTNLNRFNAKGQTSLLAMGNNVNQQGFSIGDFINFSGGAQSLARTGTLQLGGGQNRTSVPMNFDGRPSTNGLITSWAGGVNFNRTIGTGTEVTASYFYNQLDHDMNEQLDRENFLPVGNFNFQQNQVQDNQNYNHRLNMRIEQRFSERSSLLFTGSSSLNMANTFGQTSGQTFGINGELQNTGAQTIDSDGQRLNLDARLLYRQRLAKPGRTLTARADITQGNNRQDVALNAINRFFHQTVTEELILQDQNRKDWNRRLSGNITYTEPIANRVYLEGNYNLSFAMDEVNLRVFDVVVPGSDGQLNNLLSNHYENTYTYQRAGVNLMFNHDRYNLTIEGALQSSDLEGYSFSLNQDVSRNYIHFLPEIDFNYELDGRRLSVEYETSIQEPSPLQIQPVVDNRDPLNIYAGNPDLLPSYRHSWQVRFNSFNPLTSFGFFTNFTADYTNNAITNSVSVDEFLVRTITPVNVVNNINLRGNVNLNMELSSLKSHFMVGTSLSRMQSVNVLNGTSQEIVNNMLSPNFRYIFRPGDSFELILNANLNHQLTRYEFSTIEQAFLNQTYQVNASWSLLKYYRIEGNYNYSIFQGRTSEFDRKIPMLNMSFSRSFMKNNSGELKLSVFNLLDSDLGVTQTTAVNYYERSVTNSLGRYFMLTFTYSLNRQLNMMDRGPGGIPGGGRGMRMID